MPFPSPVQRPALRITVVADSIAMPQDHVDGWLWPEETWPGQLQGHLRNAGLDVEVLNRGQRNRHSYDLAYLEYKEHVTFTKPDVLILSVGVNDCAPRLFSLRQKGLINRPWFPRWLRDRIIAYGSKRRVRIISRRSRPITHSTPEEFRANVRAFLERCASEHPSCLLIVLPIFCDPAKVDAKTPGFAESTYRYNRILAELAAELGVVFIEQDRLLPEERRIGGDVFFVDGFHLNVAGSGLVAEVLAELVLARGHAKEDAPARARGTPSTAG